MGLHCSLFLLRPLGVFSLARCFFRHFEGLFLITKGSEMSGRESHGQKAKDQKDKDQTQANGEENKPKSQPNRDAEAIEPVGAYVPGPAT
jgi:hypothetical protein